MTYFQWNHLLLNNTSSFITIRKYVFVYVYVSVQIYVTFSCFATVVMLFCALLHVRLLRANKDTYIHTYVLKSAGLKSAGPKSVGPPPDLIPPDLSPDLSPAD